MAGKKKLLKSEDYSDILMPNYITIKELQKDDLLSYCLSKQTLKIYLPDSESLTNLTRQFLLKVSYF